MRRLLSLAACAALGACTVGPNHVAPGIVLTPAYTRADAIDTSGDAGGDTAAWWRRFDDPLLAGLVARAIADNPDVAVARARIDQSRAAARAAGAALLPRVDAVGAATTLSQSRETAIGRVTRALRLDRGYTELSVGAQAGWELDLFGGDRRRREASLREVEASEAEGAGVRVAIAAETADAYLGLRGVQARLAVAERQAANQETLVALVRQRVVQGVAAERELNRARAASAAVATSAAPLRAAIDAQIARLDVLLGRQPGTGRAALLPGSAIPVAPMPAGSAAPAALLRRRPDVIAAERRVAAGDARIGAALADYYPRLSLSGLVGVASLGTGSLFTGNAVEASGGAGLRWRLFDFGRVDAEVAGARARRAEALAAWRGTVLRAAGEVETALSRLAEAHAQRAGLERQVAALTRARAQARDAYAGGIVGLIEVTDADRELLAASDALALVRTEESRAAVAAYRALGGGWASDGGARP
jgi:NodT family efflux transporter outer membrane factor (OMF) lipoprotein